MTNKVIIYSLGFVLSAMNVIQAQSPSLSSGGGAVPVNVDNFARAESDLYTDNAVKDASGTGKFFHQRKTPTAPSSSNLAVATARFPTACQYVGLELYRAPLPPAERNP
jgi:hypothetical protein